MFSTSYLVPILFDVSKQALAVAQTFVRIASFMFWIYMCSAQCYFILRAGGDTIAALFMDSCYMWLVNISVVGLLTYFTDFSIFHLYLAGQLTDLLKMGLAFYMVKRGNWIVNLTKKREATYEY